MVELFGIISFIIVLFYLFQKNGYLTVPFLFSCVSLGWLTPQMLTVSRNNFELSDGLQIFSLMSLLCLIFVTIAFELGRRNTPSFQESLRENLSKSLDEATVAFIATALTGFVILMTILLGNQTAAIESRELWTGRITIIYFFHNVKMLSFFLSVCLLLKQPKKLYIVLALANAAIYFPGIFIYFRRRAFFECFFVIALAFFFVRNKTFSRIVVMAGVFIASIGVFAVGNLRDASYDKATNQYRLPSLSDLEQVDFTNSLPFISDVPSSEVRSGTILVSAADARSELSLGRQSWNRLVFQFVPAQFLGAQFKSSLLFENISPEYLIIDAGYNIHLGSTNTGIAEAFMEFSYMGCLIFAVFSWLLGIAWRYMSAGFIMGGALYVIGIIPFTLSVTAYPIYTVAYAAPQLFMFFLALFTYKFVLRANRPTPSYVRQI